MREIKDTQRALVRIGYDGRVHKKYKGPQARERYDNEVLVLQYLEKRNCDFVPRLLESCVDELYIVTTNCGAIVNKISPEKVEAIFEELRSYGVEHDDAEARNITYDAFRGRFCVIDFEFAVILESGEGYTQKESELARKKEKEK